MSSLTSPDKESQKPVDETPFLQPSPHIWRKLTIPNKYTGEGYKIRIQDVPSDRYDEVWDMFRDHYYTDEPFSRSVNISAKEEFMSFVKWGVDRILSEDFSIIAVLDNEDPKPTILGGLLLYTIVRKDDPLYKPFVFPSILKNSSEVNALNSKVNTLLKWTRMDDNAVLEELEVKRLLRENGFVVKREYRGMGIGLEIFRTALECIAQGFGIPAAASLFTNPVSQKIGARLGMKSLKKVRLVDCVDESGKKVFPDADPEITLVPSYMKYDIDK